MNLYKGRYSIFVLFALVTLVVLYSTFTVYKRAGDYTFSNLKDTLPNSPSILGEKKSLDSSDSKESPQEPNTAGLPKESPQKGLIDNNESQNGDSSDDSDNKNDNSNNNKSTPVSSEEQATLTVALEQKVNLISDQVKNKNVNPRELFLPVLVDFFGDSEMQKVFDGVQSVTFENLVLVSDTEATANCTLVENTQATEHTCYFSFYESTWYLYKTELR